MLYANIFTCSSSPGMSSGTSTTMLRVVMDQRGPAPEASPRHVGRSSEHTIATSPWWETVGRIAVLRINERCKQK